MQGKVSPIGPDNSLWVRIAGPTGLQWVRIFWEASKTFTIRAEFRIDPGNAGANTSNAAAQAKPQTDCGPQRMAAYT